MKLDILIVDDSIIYRSALFEAVEKTGLAGDIKAIARGGLALEWMKNKKVDVVLLDLYMPEMSGLEVLDLIKSDFPQTEVIMISAKNTSETDNVMKALSMGAFDFIFKPNFGDAESNIIKFRDILKIIFYSIIQKKMINSKSDFTVHKIEKKHERIEKKENIKKERKYFNNPFLILIACSTGGPVALEKIFSNQKSNIKTPILIVQHMPENFTDSLAKSLNKKSFNTIKEAENMEYAEKNVVYIAKGGYHMEVKNKNDKPYIMLNKNQKIKGLRPSADNLFLSVANNFPGKKILAIVLTGMGSDGLLGLKKLKEQCDCYCITQNEKSCLVYGMSKNVEDSNLSDESLELNQIIERIIESNNKGIIC